MKLQKCCAKLKPKDKATHEKLIQNKTSRKGKSYFLAMDKQWIYLNDYKVLRHAFRRALKSVTTADN